METTAINQSQSEPLHDDDEEEVDGALQVEVQGSHGDHSLLLHPLNSDAGAHGTPQNQRGLNNVQHARKRQRAKSVDAVDDGTNNLPLSVTISMDRLLPVLQSKIIPDCTCTPKRMDHLVHLQARRGTAQVFRIECRCCKNHTLECTGGAWLKIPVAPKSRENTTKSKREAKEAAASIASENQSSSASTSTTTTSVDSTTPTASNPMDTSTDTAGSDITTEHSSDASKTVYINQTDIPVIIQSILQGLEYSDYAHTQGPRQAVIPECWRAVEFMLSEAIHGLLYREVLPKVWARLKERKVDGCTRPLILVFDGSYIQRSSANKAGKTYFPFFHIYY